MQPRTQLAWRLRDLSDIGKSGCSKDWGQVIAYLRLLHIHCCQFSLLIFQEGFTVLALSSLTYKIPSCYSSRHLLNPVTSVPWLSRPHPSWPNHTSKLSTSHLTFFHELCIPFLLLSERSRSLLSCASFQPALPDFLHTEMESSCALKKVALKSCQLWPVPLSLRTISHSPTPQSHSPTPSTTGRSLFQSSGSWLCSLRSQIHQGMVQAALTQS